MSVANMKDHTPESFCSLGHLRGSLRGVCALASTPRGGPLAAVALVALLFCTAAFGGVLRDGIRSLRTGACTRMELRRAAIVGASNAVASTRAPPGSPISTDSLPLAGMRVLLITHELSATGAPRVCFELAQVLSSMGVETRLAAQDWTEPSAADRICKFARTALPPTLTSLNFRCSPLSRPALAEGVIVVSTAVKRNALFISTFREMYVSSAALVWWIHEGESVMNVLGEEALVLALTVLAAPGKLDAVIFVSDFCRRFWVAAAAARGLSIIAPTFILRWGMPDWKRDALDAAVLNTRSIAALRSDFGFRDDDFVFLVLASYNHLKGHAGIAKALMRANAQCPSSCRLRVLALGVALSQPGGFPAQEMAWVLKHPDFRFRPAVDDVALYLAMSDAYVSNTKRGGETWGLATLEAATAGKAVLASGVGGTLEQLEHNVSALFHAVGPSDEEEVELADHMCAIATDHVLAARLAAAARENSREQLGQAHLETELADLFGRFWQSRHIADSAAAAAAAEIAASELLPMLPSDTD